MKKRLKVIIVVVGVLAVSTSGVLIWAYRPVPTFEPVAYEPVRPAYWPTTGWRYSTPEAQGMRSERLIEMMSQYETFAAEDSELFIDSVTIVRNGHIVAEFYNNPLYPRNAMHIMHSAAKSMVSALVGIAISKAYIESVDSRVVEIFGDRNIKNLGDRKRALTIRDLLAMQTGLHSRDSYLYAHEGLFELQHAEDWLQFALDLPMAAEPGERFDYSNISTFLLSAILVEKTGMDTLEFANEHLFGPLGVEDVKWEWNKDGLPIAWARMWLRPNDMAKFGLLYLQQGNRNEQQLIPREWVRKSLTPAAFPKNAVDILNADMRRNRDASTRNWVGQRFFRPFADGYGYHWWLDRRGYYAAMGTNGQFIIVAPRENLVAVITSKSRGLAQFVPATLFFDYILDAVESDAPLPANETALAELKRLTGPPESSSSPTAVPELPGIATRISGSTYRMEPNSFSTDNIRFIFDPASDAAELSYTAREDWDVRYSIGLDGVHRLTDTNDSVFAAVGEWTSPNTFRVEVEIVGYSSFDSWEFTFEGDMVSVTEYSITGDYSYVGKAR